MANSEDSLFEEGRSSFVKSVEERFLCGDSQNVLIIVGDPNNSKYFISSGYELVPILGKYLTSQNRSERKSIFDAARQILVRIAHELTAQETYLELLELIEECDDVQFVTLLEIIRFCLSRMPKQRGKSICWACDSIVRHLCHMDVPKKTDENLDSLSKSNSTILEDICLVYEGVLCFFQPFVEEIRSGNWEISSGHIDEYKKSQISCLVKCLGRPLVHIDLTDGSKYRDLAYNFLDMIHTLNGDPLSLLKEVDMTFGCSEMLDVDAISTEFNNVSLGCYFYLIFNDDRQLENVSYVYSPEHMFECAMAMCFDLMVTNEGPLIFKALSLFDRILERVSAKTVDFNVIKDTVMSKFLEMITRNMVYNDTKRIRQLSVKVFPTFLSKITPEGQYLILLNSNQFSSDPGFTGYNLTLIKELIREALDSKNPDLLRYFSGKKLVDLVSRHSRITNIIEADLHSHTDLIMSTLNLLRYVLIRDKNDDLKLSSYLMSIDDAYLEPVKKACSLARSIYQDCGIDMRELSGPKVTVNIGGLNDLLPEMSQEEQMSMMNENLMRVDMIEYLASRVSECLTDYKNSRQLMPQ